MTENTRWQRAEPGDRCEEGSKIMYEETVGGIVQEGKGTSAPFTPGDFGKTAPSPARFGQNSVIPENKLLFPCAPRRVAEGRWQLWGWAQPVSAWREGRQGGVGGREVWAAAVQLGERLVPAFSLPRARVNTSCAEASSSRPS